jgi:hypothetical protein
MMMRGLHIIIGIMYFTMPVLALLPGYYVQGRYGNGRFHTLTFGNP